MSNGGSSNPSGAPICPGSGIPVSTAMARTPNGVDHADGPPHPSGTGPPTSQRTCPMQTSQELECQAAAFSVCCGHAVASS
jgi:hypothetical protein